MSKRQRRIVQVVVLVGVVAVGVTIAVKLRQQQAVITETTDTIRSQLDDLDPISRAMVRERLAEDVVAEVRHQT